MEEHLEEHSRVQGGSIKGSSRGWHGARGGAIRVKATQLKVGGISGRCEGGLLQGSSGLGVETLTREVGGIDWPICDGDWATVLEDLGVQVAGLQREFYLSAVPVEDTLTVWVDVDGEREDFTEGADFDYSRTRNSVRFRQYVPEPQAQVFVEYEPLAEARASEIQAE